VQQAAQRGHCATFAMRSCWRQSRGGGDPA